MWLCMRGPSVGVVGVYPCDGGHLPPIPGQRQGLPRPHDPWERPLPPTPGTFSVMSLSQESMLSRNRSSVLPLLLLKLLLCMSCLWRRGRGIRLQRPCRDWGPDSPMGRRVANPGEAAPTQSRRGIAWPLNLEMAQLRGCRQAATPS